MKAINNFKLHSGINGEARVLEILRSVKSIESWDLAERALLMDNTSNKYVKYLRDKGHIILTETVEGKSCCRFVYISGPQNEIAVKTNIKKNEVKLVIPMDTEELIEECLRMAATYPFDHFLLEPIMHQVSRLEAKLKRVA